MAPSTELRRWLDAHRSDYPELCVGDQAELGEAERKAALKGMRSIPAEGRVVLLPAARTGQESQVPVIRNAI